MKAYSIDLRERALAALDRGMSRASVVATFQVSQGSIKRWLRARRETGDLTPRRPPGRPATIQSTQTPALRAQLEQHPDATLAEHAAHWNADTGTTLSQWSLGRAIRALGWSRKKSR
jgi:transposase